MKIRTNISKAPCSNYSGMCMVICVSTGVFLFTIDLFHLVPGGLIRPVGNASLLVSLIAYCVFVLNLSQM